MGGLAAWRRARIKHTPAHTIEQPRCRDLGGRIRSGRHIQLPSWGSSVNSANSTNVAPLAYPKRPQDGRTVNALWATLLHAAGSPVDGFNLGKAPAGLDKPGPIEELLA